MDVKISLNADVKESNGSIYHNDECIFNYPDSPYSEYGAYEVERIIQIYVTREYTGIYLRMPLASYDIYRYLNIGGFRMPTKNGVPRDSIYVKLLWKDGSESVIDFNDLAVSTKKNSKTSQGKRASRYDDTYHMRQVLILTNSYISESNNKLSPESEKCIIYERSSAGKTPDDLSLHNQLDCNIQTASECGYIIIDNMI